MGRFASRSTSQESSCTVACSVTQTSLLGARSWPLLCPRRACGPAFPLQQGPLEHHCACSASDAAKRYFFRDKELVLGEDLFFPADYAPVSKFLEVARCTPRHVL